MTLRTIAREIRDYPATAFFSIIWVLVFVGMVVHWMNSDPLRACGGCWCWELVKDIGSAT